MRRARCFWLGAISLLHGAAAPASFAASLADFAPFSLTSGASTLLPGRLYIPPAAVSDPTTQRPMILFLHGAGESGTNNAAQVNGNIDNLLAEAKRRGAFLYAPQTNAGWSNMTVLNRVDAMLDRALAEHPVDASRVYVTGISMGGGGTWNMLARFEDRFAAAVPICAVSPNTSFNAADMIDMPIWAFHARDDGVVSYTSTRNVVTRILSAAGEPLPSYPVRPQSDFAFVSSTLDLRHTEYRLGGHGIWGRVYATPAMYEWLFSHTTAVPEPAGVSAWLIAAWVGVRRPKRRAPSACAKPATRR